MTTSTDWGFHAFTTTRDDHTQYARTDGTRAFTGDVTVSGTITVTSLTQTTDDAAWTNASLSGLWLAVGAPFLTPGYRKVNGRIYLRGAAKSGTGVIFVLPTGYRPSGTMEFLTDSSGATLANIQIDSSGNVTFETGNNAAVFLDGISFDTL